MITRRQKSWRFGVKADSLHLSKCPSHPLYIFPQNKLQIPPRLNLLCSEVISHVDKVPSTHDSLFQHTSRPPPPPQNPAHPLRDHRARISSYNTESRTWAVQKNLHPRFVIRPTSLHSLSTTLAYLSKTQLDFAIRSQGFSSSSAKDVLISMTAFDGFDFDRENEFVTVGAGQTWRDYYRKMDETAPDYAGMFACLLASLEQRACHC